MPGGQRRFLACMTVLAAGVAGAQALLGVPELALYFAPRAPRARASFSRLLLTV